MTSAWSKDFTPSEHEKLKDILPNLIPLSAPLNINLSNKSYAIKKKRYKADAMYKSARALGEKNEEWNPAAIARRGKLQASWACKRWKY